jgi:uncharacterized protein YjhX (UPF0386 family)
MGYYHFWKVENNFNNHWTYTRGWGMVECMNNVVLATTKMAIQTIKCINVSCNEVTSIDNQSWIFVHVFVVKDFKRTPIFVNLEGVIKSCTMNNDHESITKVVCFNVDGATTFQSITIGVSTQLKKKPSHFYIPMHCVVHGTNLVVFTLYDFSIITKIETLLVGVYAYFNHSPKWNVEN